MCWAALIWSLEGGPDAFMRPLVNQNFPGLGPYVLVAVADAGLERSANQLSADGISCYGGPLKGVVSATNEIQCTGGSALKYILLFFNY
jgi:hypothetical protein